MEQSPSWQANSYLGTLYPSPRMLRNRVHKTTPRFPYPVPEKFSPQQTTLFKDPF